MDENKTTINNQISSLLLGHLLSSSPCSITSASSSCVGFSEHGAKPMPFSSFSSFVPSSVVATAEKLGDGESAMPLGFDPVSLLQGDRGNPQETLDFDGYDCESEEGMEVPEEPAKPAASRSSKRSRAAEVHNLSEKRRRSRINEKMKALQNLIPNSNKTDKASMLDEAIEYLKQLQLQVQLLSMRNGLSLHPMYFPGALQPLQASQMRLPFSEDDGSMLNMGVGMLHMNQDSSAQNSFEPSNQCLTSHQSIIPSCTNIINQDNSFGVEATQSHQASFHLSMAAEEAYREDMLSQHQLDTCPSSRNLPENQMESMDPPTSLPFDEQASILDGTNHLKACISSSGKSQNMLSKNQENDILIHHMHALQTGKSNPDDEVKAEMLDY